MNSVSIDLNLIMSMCVQLPVFVGLDQIKGCQVQTVRDYINHNDCQSETMDLTFCGGDCNSFSR